MLFTRAVISALLKMDQEIVETTTGLLAGLILSDWFESQMPRWCLNNCKGRKSYCVTTCLAMYPLTWWNFAQNMDYCPFPGHQTACMWQSHEALVRPMKNYTWESSEHKKMAIMKNTVIQKQNLPLSLKKFMDVLEPNTGKRRVTSPHLTFSR